MRRTTALLIVTLLAGTPGIALACEFWCNTPAAEAHRRAVGCHRAPDADGVGAQVAAATAECHDAPAVTAFLTESRQPETPSVAMVPAAHGTAVPVHRDPIDDGWSTRNGQPPCPPAFRTILRI